MTLPLILVAAVADNGVIGRDNRLPWRQRTDLRRFKALTLGKPILMGRRTFESLDNVLAGRQTIVITHDTEFEAPGVIAAHSIPAAIAAGERAALALGADAVIGVGGEEIYRLLMPLADRLQLTKVHARPEGDAFFPPVDPAVFRESFREEHPAGPHDEHAFAFVDYDRVSAKAPIR